MLVYQLNSPQISNLKGEFSFLATCGFPSMAQPFLSMLLVSFPLLLLPSLSVVNPAPLLPNFSEVPLKSVTGPESIAFDCNGEGPYTGVSDGRIFKWNGDVRGWTEFAVTSQHRRRDVCDGTRDTQMEKLCGRPLGLQLHKATCDLYIADAYFGILKVGPAGGRATPVVTGINGRPFVFTNALDVDPENGVIYFTDSSRIYQRKDFMQLIFSGDKTGRLMKYDPQTRRVTVLMDGLAFANGVALSNDSSFLLVAETTFSRIHRFWLKGSKTGTSEHFAIVPGFPDNIKISPNGEFWVALNTGQELPQQQSDGEAAVKLGEDGKILQALGTENSKLKSISEVKEKDGMLWIGSVVTPFMGLYKV